MSGEIAQRMDSFARATAKFNERSAACAASFENDPAIDSGSSSASFENDPPPALGAAVIPHHRSSVRTVAHRFNQGTGVSAFLGMADGQIFEANDPSAGPPPSTSFGRRGAIPASDAAQASSSQRNAALETKKLGRHRSSITSMVIHRDTLISASKDGQIKLWDARKGSTSSTPSATLTAASGVRALAASSLASVLSAARLRCPPNSLLASCLPDAILFSGGDDGALAVWNLSGPKTAEAAGVMEHGVLIRSVLAYGPVVALVSVGRLLISASVGKYLCFWDTLSPVFETCLTLPTGSEVYALAVLGNAVYGGCADGTIRSWTLTSRRIGAHLLKRVTAHAGYAIRHLALMDNSVLLSASEGGVLQAWSPGLEVQWSGGDPIPNSPKEEGARPRARTPRASLGGDIGLFSPRGKDGLPTAVDMTKLAAESQQIEGELRCVRLYKRDTAQALGLSFCCTGGPPVIAAILPGGLAQQTGLLSLFDTLLSVNGEGSYSSRAVVEMLSAARDEVELVVRRAVPASSANNGSSEDSEQNTAGNTAVVGWTTPRPRPTEPILEGAGCEACVSETVSVKLHKVEGEASLGVLLYRFTQRSPIISELEARSCAAASGQLFAGDVVLAVGGVAAAGLEHVAELLAAAADDVTSACVELLLRRLKSRRRTSSESDAANAPATLSPPSPRNAAMYATDRATTKPPL